MACHPIRVQLNVLAAAVAASVPLHGMVVPGTSLGGLHLGDTQQQVTKAWGTKFGVCRDCARTTWYYNSTPYEPQGAAVEFRRGRVVALYTLWSPTGWHTPQGLRTGDPATSVTSVYGPLTRLDCGTYQAYQLPRRNAVTAFYVFGEKVWGFGLSRRSVPVCR
jgi:hypothetical protein